MLELGEASETILGSFEGSSEGSGRTQEQLALLVTILNKQGAGTEASISRERNDNAWRVSIGERELLPDAVRQAA